jgi:probable addiction module antidote protein
VKRKHSADSFAIAYLNVVLEEADQEELISALSRIARTCGGSRLVEKIEISAPALFRTLCLRGNPELKSTMALLKAMGIRLTVQPIPGRRAGDHRGADLQPVVATSRATLARNKPEIGPEISSRRLPVEVRNLR